MDSVPIVDAAVVYDHPSNFNIYHLILRNVLYVPLMSYHLLPPFTLQEAGLIVNETPKCQVQGAVTEVYHSIYHPSSNLRIPLSLNGTFSSLNGTFSYFPTRAPSSQDLANTEATAILLTPEGPQWNPNTELYAQNESNFLDWEGNIIDPAHCDTQLLHNIDCDVTDDMEAQIMSAMATLESLDSIYTTDELIRIYDVCGTALITGEPQQLPSRCELPPEEDSVAASMASIDPILNVEGLASSLHNKAAES